MFTGTLYDQLLKKATGLQSHRDNVSADLCVHFVSGGMAGITAATSTYPLDLVRTRLAAQVYHISFIFVRCSGSPFPLCVWPPFSFFFC